MTLEECILDAALVFLIPSSSQKNLPSGRDIFDKKDLLTQAPTWLHEGAQKLNTFSIEEFSKSFLEINETEQQLLLTKNQRKLTAFLNNIMIPLITQYYSNDQVLKGIGYGDRPPFPEGHEVIEGDLTLLEDVYGRGLIYKTTPT